MCQEDDKDTLLVDTQRNKDESVKNSTYKSMADRLVEFQRYGKIPMNITLDRLDDGTRITNTLHAAKQGHQRILLRATDTDVVVSAISLFRDLAGKNKQAKHVEKYLNWTVGVGVGSKIPTPTPSILRSLTPTLTPSKTSNSLRL